MKKDIPKGAVSTKVPPAEVDPIDLPENAFRELAADEEYRPLMHPAREYQEVTPYSVTMGLILAVVFVYLIMVAQFQSLLSPFITVPFVDGKITVGPWQNLTLVECDTRNRVRDIVFQVL